MRGKLQSIALRQRVKCESLRHTRHSRDSDAMLPREEKCRQNTGIDLKKLFPLDQSLDYSPICCLYLVALFPLFHP